MIETNIKKLRDPFLLKENGVYYMYGTGVEADNDWKRTQYTCYRNTSGKLDGNWVKVENLYVKPETGEKNFWAPEVHKYRDNFYMFTTYFSSVTQKRGSTILKATSPEGPFTEITNGTITPPDWHCIDSTFYIDSKGQPWMVFVHEWPNFEDKIGKMAVAKLSDDLTHLISEPKDIFRADDAPWAGGRGVTDGCFLYTTKKGSLLMIWSNFDSHGYAVGIARSKNGRPDGEWEQEEKLLYSKSMGWEYDGGHGMIFQDTDGKKYLCIHAPNTPTADRNEVPIILPVIEKDDTLVCEPE